MLCRLFSKLHLLSESSSAIQTPLLSVSAVFSSVSSSVCKLDQFSALSCVRCDLLARSLRDGPARRFFFI